MADEDVTTIGTLLINAALPPDMRKRRHVLDKKGVHKLFMELAVKHPEQYSQVIDGLSNVGKRAAWTEGLSVSLEDLRKSKAKEKILGPARAELRDILADDSLSDSDRRDAITSLMMSLAKPLQEAVLEESKANRSGFAVQIESGARGNKSSLSSLKGADLLASDQRDRVIAVPLLHSYAEGYTPAEYFAAAYGQRKGMLDVKMATADAGYLCLSGDTLVRMADWSVKPISAITVDEWVLGANTEGSTFPVRVSAVFDHGEQQVATYRFRPGRNRELVSLTATPKHKMLAVRKVGKQSTREATTLPLEKADSDYCVVAAARDERYVFAFVDKSPVSTCRVYDIEVDHSDHLFVLASGMITSNSKQIVNAAHRQVVTRDQPAPYRLPVGLPVETSDKDNIGAVLAADVGTLKAGTVLTDEHLQDLQDQDVDEILVHSPMTEMSEDGGISAWAAGRRVRTGLHQIGDNVGIPAAQAIGERLSQGVLDSKHSAGVNTRVSKSGFGYLNNLIQAPENFPDAGPLTEDDGIVEEIRAAPQGGHYIKVAGREYYAGANLTPTVKVGDTLERGDDLTDGTPHPQQLVRLRGVGEARRVYLRELRDALNNSGVPAHRRNVESVVAGLINWARVTDPDGVGDNIYDDVAPVGHLLANYAPRKDAEQLKPQQAIGKYLEEPVLHYTPGTRITRKVADRLKKWKIDNIFAHPQAPGFEPEMVRGMLSVYHDPDWQTRLGGFYTARAFSNALHRGAESDTRSTSFYPALAKGEGFGKNLRTLGKYGEDWNSDSESVDC